MTPAVDIAGLRIDLGGRPVLRGIDLRLHRGELVVLPGANGAGKSTLLRCMAAIHRASAGTVRVDGVDVAIDPRAARARLGFAVDARELPDLLTGAECLRLFARLHGLADVPGATHALAAEFGLDAVLGRPLGTYSLGMRQKLGALLGLLADPPLLLFDETLNGLDAASARRLKHELASRCAAGACIVLATHALDVAERLASRVVLLHEGRVAAQWDAHALEALRASRASLEDAFAVALDAAARGIGENAAVRRTEPTA